MAHDELIRREFTRQAAGFGAAGSTLSSQAYLDWMVGQLPLQPDFRVLDVATGTGHLARAIAPRVREVVGVDLTPAMLQQARQEAARAGLDNVRFEEGDAAALPYADASFDLVVSRLSLHHFERPARQLAEMVRVCRPGHAVGIIDLLSPDEPELVAVYNDLERMRDPSHTLALTRLQLEQLLRDAGLALETVDARDIVVDFARWVALTGVAEAVVETLRGTLLAELEGGPPTGMRPFVDEGRLAFLQSWSVVVGTRAAAVR